MDRERNRRFVAALDARRRTLAEEVEEDIAGERGLTLEQHGERVAIACRSGWAILRERPDFPAIAAYRDPLPDDFAEIWARLMARRRKERGGAG